MSRMSERTRRIKNLEIGESVNLPARNEREITRHRAAVRGLKQSNKYRHYATRRVPGGLMVWRLPLGGKAPELVIGNEKYNFDRLQQPGDHMSLSFPDRTSMERAATAARQWAARRGWKWSYIRGREGGQYILRIRFPRW